VGTQAPPHDSVMRAWRGSPRCQGASACRRCCLAGDKRVLCPRPACRPDLSAANCTTPAPDGSCGRSSSAADPDCGRRRPLGWVCALRRPFVRQQEDTPSTVRLDLRHTSCAQCDVQGVTLGQPACPLQRGPVRAACHRSIPAGWH
jgi:hypothetical protein